MSNSEQRSPRQNPQPACGRSERRSRRRHAPIDRLPLVLAGGLAWVAAAAAAASDATRDEHAADPHHDDAHDRIVHLSPADLEEFDIVIGEAAPATVEHYLSLPGEVRPNADRLAHIVPRYSGIVTDTRANIGDRVARGETLAVIESDQSLAPFAVKTLISGTVIAKHVTLGEAVSRDREIYVIADLAKVWIDLTVYQRDLELVRTGQRAEIYVGHDLAEGAGTISYVTPVVDERTRTATARVVLPNPDGRWRPGMFVTGRVLVDTHAAAVAVPRSALHVLDGETVVFVRTGDGIAARSVELGRTGAVRVEILSGLAPGASYVVRGGFTLKAELGKGQFRAHGHAH